MAGLFITAWVLLVMYVLLLGWYKNAWQGLRYVQPKPVSGKTRVTVIIPARNEEQYIGDCIKSIRRQNYPEALTEVIVVNDGSTDRTAEIVRAAGGGRVHVLELGNFLSEKKINSYKKKGIELAVQQSNGELVITTDADCTMGEEWLSTIVSFYEQTNAAFIAAPVTINATSRFVEMFQAVDFTTLQGITGAAVHKKTYQMCNGANLAYTREAFNQVNGFSGIDDIASGDDLLLMYKIFEAFPNRVMYLKSKAAMVYTQPVSNWRGFFNQRIRWASKTSRYKNRKMFFTLLGVYLLNVACLFLIVYCIVQPVYLGWLILFLLVKTVAELNFLLPVARFFSNRKLLWWFPLFQPVHILYTVIAGWLGTFGTYTWKGRRVR